MDISGVLTPATNQATRQRAGDSIGISVLNKALDTEVAAAASLVQSAVEQSPEVPQEKLPAHLGRNINVKA